MKRMKLRRYLVFAGHDYYPSGGWDDFRMSFWERSLAEKFIMHHLKEDWFQLVDLETGEVITRIDQFGKSGLTTY